jgi:hypothetical protein
MQQAHCLARIKIRFIMPVGKEFFSVDLGLQQHWQHEKMLENILVCETKSLKDMVLWHSLFFHHAVYMQSHHQSDAKYCLLTM